MAINHTELVWLCVFVFAIRLGSVFNRIKLNIPLYTIPLCTILCASIIRTTHTHTYTDGVIVLVVDVCMHAFRRR